MPTKSIMIIALTDVKIINDHDRDHDVVLCDENTFLHHLSNENGISTMPSVSTTSLSRRYFYSRIHKRISLQDESEVL